MSNLDSSSRRGTLVAVAAATLGSIVLYLAGTFTGSSALWAFSAGGFVSVTTGLTMLLALLVEGVIVWRAKWTTAEDSPVKPAGLYSAVSIAFVALFALACVMARVKFHFLGDGYSVLGALSVPDPLLKTRNLGAGMVTLWLRDLVGGADQASALIAFRISAVSSGILLLSVAAWAAARLFNHFVDRILLLLAVATGGYALLSFGYVENYALFVACVGTFTLYGAVVVEGQAPRWIVLPPAVLACFFHIFGFFLLPAVIMLLLSKTQLSRWFCSISIATRTLMAVVSGIVLVAAYFAIRPADLQLTFVLLPLLPDRFTVDEYTLFSLRHLTDFVNLLFLLVPGLLPLLIVALSSYRRGERRQWPGWLLFLSLSLLAAVFVINPGLGMARDWDLLSFCGPPLLIGLTIIALRTANRAAGRLTVSLAIVLGIAGLSTRVAVLRHHDSAAEQFLDFANRYPLKNQSSLFAMAKQYTNDSANVTPVLDSLAHRFPQHPMVLAGENSFANGKYDEAARMARAALARNYVHHQAHALLGATLLKTKRYDSAAYYLRIAAAMNPYNGVICNNLATTCMFLGNWGEARKWSDRSLAVTSDYRPLIDAVAIRLILKDTTKAVEYFRQLTSRNDIPCTAFKALAGDFLRAGLLAKAREARHHYESCIRQSKKEGP